MPASPLAPELRRFVAAKIDSIAMLEALLLLRSRDGAWTIRELAERLYLSDARVDGLVQGLAREQLASVGEAGVGYAPGTPELAARVEELAETYSRHVVLVTELIHSGVDRRARDFADAFRLRRDE